MEENKTKRGSYLVEGMTCSGCERTIQRVIGNIDGVRSSKADLESSTVSVDYEPAKVSIDQIRAAVDSVGYKFMGERPAYGQREGSDEAIA